MDYCSSYISQMKIFYFLIHKPPDHFSKSVVSFFSFNLLKYYVRLKSHTIRTVFETEPFPILLKKVFEYVLLFVAGEWRRRPRLGWHVNCAGVTLVFSIICYTLCITGRSWKQLQVQLSIFLYIQSMIKMSVWSKFAM